MSAVAALSEDQLKRVVREESGWDARYAILHGLHDEASHCGEIALLRKQQLAGK